LGKTLSRNSDNWTMGAVTRSHSRTSWS